LDRFVSKMRMYAVREQLLARKPAPHVSNPVLGFASTHHSASLP